MVDSMIVGVLVFIAIQVYVIADDVKIIKDIQKGIQNEIKRT